MGVEIIRHQFTVDEYHRMGEAGILREDDRVGDVWRLIEVSDTTVPFDRTVKVPLYARAGIAEVWLVDLGADRVEVYRRPVPDGRYGDVRRVARGDRLIGEAVPDLDVAVDAILG
jgi:putative restriction endonuclease